MGEFSNRIAEDANLTPESLDRMLEALTPKSDEDYRRWFKENARNARAPEPPPHIIERWRQEAMANQKNRPNRAVPPSARIDQVGEGPNIDTNYATVGNNEGEEPWEEHEPPVPPQSGEGPDAEEDDDAEHEHKTASLHGGGQAQP